MFVIRLIRLRHLFAGLIRSLVQDAMALAFLYELIRVITI